MSGIKKSIEIVDVIENGALKVEVFFVSAVEGSLKNEIYFQV